MRGPRSSATRVTPARMLRTSPPTVLGQSATTRLRGCSWRRPPAPPGRALALGSVRSGGSTRT
eukprot:15451834-Alexandrium_andersonii.AAC.1